MTRAVRIALAGGCLHGDLTVPRGAAGLVIFAHGSGSSRHSPRNRLVAARINASGLATLLMDLLTAEEEHDDEATGRWRFDIPLLADRVAAVTRWCSRQPGLCGLDAGIFGSSTGAAAALMAAAGLPAGAVKTVVSRGGRPDLAGEALPRVACPTLLIVGGRDHAVIGLNEDARGKMACHVELAVVPGATHLFEEPGALEQVADLAAAWFGRYLGSPGR